jgi:stage V sporulation protein R
MVIATTQLLYPDADWDFETIQRIYDAVERVATSELGLNVYPNQIEIITGEQMLDAYASTGMPLFYKHWSFGKHFAQHQAVYQEGLRGLAYEIVINSSPCISYIIEENTATMQTLVIAHAAFGHNHFFKNNYLFRAWTEAEGILPYLEFAKSYVAECEERYGQAEVERLLDAAHALRSHGVYQYPRKKSPDLASEERRERERRLERERTFNDLWRTIPTRRREIKIALDEERRRVMLELPQENILYFLEKSAPRLQPWHRELLRIVRLVEQYFYPQKQTKVINEGCATYCHYRIMERLHERGEITDGAFLEFLKAHTSVVCQPGFDEPHFGGINPYALGFAMMRDIERICQEPTEEDREWFPDLAGLGNPVAALQEIWADYRDESFIAQFLSPRLIREWRLFHLADSGDEPYLRVASIHDARGYRRIRRSLARQHDIAWTEPDIQVVDVDLSGDRRLVLHHSVLKGVLLDAHDAAEVMQHLADLWGYDVVLKEVDRATTSVLDEHAASPVRPFT